MFLIKCNIASICKRLYETYDQTRVNIQKKEGKNFIIIYLFKGGYSSIKDLISEM